MKIFLTVLLVFVCLLSKAQIIKPITVTLDGKYYKDTISDPGTELEKSTDITVYKFDVNTSFFEAKLNGVKIFFKKNDALPSREFNLWTQKIIDTKLKSLQNQLYNLLVKAYGVKYANDVINQRIELGMPKAAAFKVLGKPSSINRTVIPNLTKEQWIYEASGEKTRYYYFSNGRLSAWQD